MKNLIQIVTLCIALFLVACGKSPQQSEPNDTNSTPEHSIPADLTEAEREFLEMVEQAFSQNVPDPLVDRICWDGIDDMLHDMLDDYIVDGVKRGLKTFDFQRVDPKAHTEITEGGTTTVANLPVKWVLVVSHPSDEGMEVSSEYLLGEKDGLIQFTNAIAQ